MYGDQLHPASFIALMMSSVVKACKHAISPDPHCAASRKIRLHCEYTVVWFGISLVYDKNRMAITSFSHAHDHISEAYLGIAIPYHTIPYHRRSGNLFRSLTA